MGHHKWPMDPSVVVVCPERAMRTTFFPARTEHEVINNELALAAEQMGQSYPALRPVEDIFLLDFDPGQLSPLFVQFVTQLRELFFFHEQFLAGGEPFFLGHDSAVFGSIDGLDFGHNGLLCFIWDTFQTLATRDPFDPTDARLMSTHLLAGRTSSDHPGSQF